MQEITYMEAIELAAFGGRKDIVAFTMLGEIGKLTLNDIRICADNGGRFFVQDEPEKKETPVVEDPLSEGLEAAARELTPAEQEIMEHVAEITREQPKKPKKPTAVVDHGKILALHKAGWNVQKIADEMRVSDQTIRNHLNREKLIAKK